MKKYSIFLFLLTLNAVIALHAQRIPESESTREFTFSFSQQPITNSQYNKIQLIDLRTDTLRFGFGQYGPLNHKRTLVAQPRFAQQLTDNLNKMIDASAKNDTLAIALKNLMFSERTGAFNEEGYCSIVADLYKKSNNGFYFIQAIDTLVKISYVDVTKRLMHKSDSIFNTFIYKNLTNNAVSTKKLSLFEVTHSDSLAKREIHLYNHPIFKDGIYLSYESFKNQQPEMACSAKESGMKLKSVKTTNAAGKEEEVDPAKVYGIVYNSKPYVCSKFGFYRLKFKDDNWYLIGKLPASMGSGVAMTSYFLFGFVGMAIANETHKSAYFYSAINYKNGQLIRIKEITFGQDESEESNWYCSE
ncbi:MAG: hypothetical protein RIS29_1700 [Bacteroidota bacterium]|jgi:hypothetical protein